MENYTKTTEKHPLRHILFRNPLLKTGIFLAGTAVAFAIDRGIEKTLTTYFPEYYETDAKEILENQDKHFDELKISLLELKREVSTEEGKRVTKRIGSLLSQARSDNKKLILSLNAIQTENSNLRKMLQEKKGIDGGTDIRIIDREGVKIDSKTTIGASYNIIRNAVELRITNNGELKKAIVESGEGLNYKNEKGLNCTITYLSGKSRDVLNFSNICK